jgi:2-methylcitrate dehydratase PrpD
MNSGPRTRRVAEFVHDLRWVDIPEDVQAQAIRCVLDLCGAAVAGSRARVARIAAAYALGAHGSGTATIIGTDGGSTAVGAALANGFAASALDVDDGYRPVKGHPGAVVFPALLAAVEQAASTGADFLTGLVVAYEVAMRAGRILHPLYGFYHGTGAWGPIGAASGAPRLLGCTREQTWHALGIAEFHAAMTPEMRSVDCPSMLKDGIGWGAMVGLGAALLAAHGFTGIPSLFDTTSPTPAVGGPSRPSRGHAPRRAGSAWPRQTSRGCGSIPLPRPCTCGPRRPVPRRRPSSAYRGRLPVPWSTVPWDPIRCWSMAWLIPSARRWPHGLT